MQNKVSLLLVADDSQFYSQVSRAGEKAGEAAGKNLVAYMQSTTSRQMQNWQLPGSKSIGETAGKNIGIGINNTFPALLAKRQKKKANTNSDALREELGADEPVLFPLPRVRKKNPPNIELFPLPTVRSREQKQQERNLNRNNLREDLGVSQPILLPLPTVKPKKQRNSPPINSPEGFDPFGTILRGADTREDPLIRKALQQQAAAAEKKRRQQEAAAKKKRQQQEAAAEKTQQQLDTSNQQLNQENLLEAEASSGNSQDKRNLHFQSKKQAINNKYNNKRAADLEAIKKLEFDRTQAIEIGDFSQNDYYQIQINRLATLINKNEELRESELRLLAVQKIQADVLAKRKDSDQQIKDDRSRRDQELATGLSQNITKLESQKPGINDKVTLAAINQEIANARSEAAKTKKLNRTNDDLADLNTNSNRRDENKRLGISDPKLDNINFGKERAILTNRRQTAETNYEQQKDTHGATFQKITNDENDKSQQFTTKETRQLQIDALKAQLENTNNKEVKVKIQFEIDQAKLTAKFEDTKNKLQETLNTLQQRQTTLGNLGIIDPNLNKLIGDVRGLITEAEKNKNDALKVLASQALLNAALAKTTDIRKNASNQTLLATPGITLAQQQSKDLISQNKFIPAAALGRTAATEAEDLRYNNQKATFNQSVSAARAAGTDIPQPQVDKATNAIDQLHNIKVASITQEFDDLARSVDSGTLALRKMTQTEMQGFLSELISGTKSFDDIWKKTLDNIVQGMVKILAQEFTQKLYDGKGSKDTGGGLAGIFVSGLGQIFGFNNGGIIPGGQGHEAYRSGNNPLAAAIRKEGQGATVIVGKQGERILNLPETAAYHQKYPNGILNYAQGGIIGGSSNSISPGSFSQLGGILSGKFDVDLKSDGRSQPAANEQLSSKFTQAIRGVLANEIRPGGILAQFT